MCTITNSGRGGKNRRVEDGLREVCVPLQEGPKEVRLRVWGLHELRRQRQPDGLAGRETGGQMGR